MMKKFIAVLTAVLMLGGCSGNSAEISDTEAAAAEISETETEETAAAETEEVTEAETAAKEKKEISTEANGTPANELYEVYPMRIIYPEKQETDITAEEVKIDEEFEKDGVVINKFSAAYPVFSGGNKEAVQKINDYIKAYVDNIYEELRQDAENYTFEDGFSVDGFPYSMCGFLYEQSVTAGGYSEYKDDCYDVNGNILSVYFIDYGYGAGAAHGYETPVSLAFDLRTGERVDFNETVGDKAGLFEVLSKALYDYLYAYNYTSSSYHNTDADKYAEYNEERIGRLKNENLKYGFESVRDGCVCFYLAPYDYGCYADGIRRIDVPINDILPYLNEAGKSLFEGCVSAESEPVNVIEYKGKRYFDNISPRLTIEVDIYIRGTTYPDGTVEIIDYNYYWRRGEFPPKMLELTDEDYEFFGLFPNVTCIEFHGCSNIDFEKLAKIKNIENITELELEYCEFGDISPLIETNINYISGKGGVIPFEQAEAFESREGNYIGYDNVGPEYIEYKGHTFALTGSGVEISDRELDEVDYEYIAAQEEIWRLEFVRCTLDYERLADFGNFKYLALKECENIDFAAIAKIDFINSIRLDHCVFDDISPLYGSGITRIDGEKTENGFVSNIQMQEFEKFNGGWVDSYLVG